MHIDELDTPAYLVDLDVMERNIASMADHCRNLDIALRCHTKSHKIPEIAHRQVKAGAIGIACQKLGEAEVMAAAGIENILIPYNIVGARKVERLTRVSRRAEIIVAVDNEITARGMSGRALQDNCRVYVIIELDTGTQRCGVQSPEAAADLAERIMDLRGLVFKGIMVFPSHPRPGVSCGRPSSESPRRAFHSISSAGAAPAARRIRRPWAAPRPAVDPISGRA